MSGDFRTWTYWRKYNIFWPMKVKYWSNPGFSFSVKNHNKFSSQNFRHYVHVRKPPDKMKWFQKSKQACLFLMIWQKRLCVWSCLHYQRVRWKMPKEPLHKPRWRYALGCLAWKLWSMKVLCKEWGLEKETKVNPWFLMVKHSEIILFLHLHFTWLYGSWHPKRILKK